MLPLEGDPRTIGARAIADRKGLIMVVAFLPAFVAILAVSSALNAGFLSSVAWSGYLAGAGLLLVYRNADESERVALRRVVAAPTRRTPGDRRVLYRNTGFRFQGGRQGTERL
jgi:hypothetical protein